MHHWEIQWIYYLHSNPCAHLIFIRTCKNQTHQNKFELKATAECQIFISQRAVFNVTSAKSSDRWFNLVKVFWKLERFKNYSQMFVGIIQSQTRSLISFEQELKTHHYLFKIKVRNETRNENRNRPQSKGRFRIDSLLIFLT